MSYGVHTYSRGRDGKFEETLSLPYAETRAGGHAWGEAVYSSEIVKSLGCTLLPTIIEHGVLFADTEEELTVLHHEAQAIVANIGLLVEATLYEEEYVSDVMRNIINAVAKAREIKGGVVIW